MRKQTKLVAVLSAAALLAIGASMTSFAKGWTPEGDEWVYLDKYGDRVYNEWQRSGDNVYYLGDDGVMVTDALVEYKDAIYYVNEYGVKVTNNWVRLDNDDDITVDTKDVDVLYYYFGANGKAVRATGTSNYKTSEIDGRKYIFDAEGHMISGWTHVDDALYYLGTEEEGWAYTGWQYLEPEADDYDYEDEEWYFFQSSGKAHKASADKETLTKYIGGRYYTFDENGVLISDWYDLVATSPQAASGADAYTTVYGSGDGWVYTTAKDVPDGDEYWYYLTTVRDADGKVVARGVPFNNNGMYGDYAAKTIKSKTYLFDSTGKMKTGLIELEEDTVADTRAGAIALKEGYYYFNQEGGSVNGQMMTGKVTVTKEGEEFYYYFRKSAVKDANGEIVHSVGEAYTDIVKDGCYYREDGTRLQAEDSNSYELFKIGRVKVDGKKDKDGNQLIVGSDSEYVAINASGRIKTSGSVRIDGVIYDINQETYVATVRPNQN